MKAVTRKKAMLPQRGHDHSHEPHRPTAEQLFHAPGEAPAVYSVTRSVAFSGQVAGSAVTSAMVRCVEAVRDWAVRERYLVGHIKVFVETDREHLWLASTGRRINIQPSEGWEPASSAAYRIHFTAIVFGPGQDSLQEVVTGHLQRELTALHA